MRLCARIAGRWERRSPAAQAGVHLPC